eukprot:CAMPEP_0195282264 /NCGR_PEP_ID=MMETSP0707-20130614/1214_1 /TAXON_ID=33640 /ORGANISM="Asterionellopsis glacialis, Strain CCMP134" /LENGTH=525 /DNA_ID=CAMNT_0040341221 /DNA_START=203 /DNA_END=1780 /DNA_ORIENTATION=-
MATIITTLLMRQGGPFSSTSAVLALSTTTTTTTMNGSPTRMAKRKSSSLIVGNEEIQSVMAPMVAQSDAPFRFLGRNHGCDLCFTQMLHARKVVSSSAFRKAHLDVFPKDTTLQWEDLSLSQQNCLQGLTYTPTPWPSQGPLVAQLAGHDPSLMVQAAHTVLEHSQGTVHGIDVNLGCPQGIARKGRYGAFLMEEDTTLVCTILKNLRQSLPEDVAVSAKIRIPLDHNLVEQRVLQLIDTGINFLTVHGRTLKENKTLVGPCHTNLIQKAVQVAHTHTPNFPVIANGGVESFADVARIQEETGASAIMSSESLLETPTLFEERSANIIGPPQQQGSDITTVVAQQLLEHQLSIAREYLDWCVKYPPTPGSLGHMGGSFNVIRTHLFKMLHRYLKGEHSFRNRLADGTQMTSIVQAYQFLKDLEDHYQQNKELLQSVSDVDSSWYRRHWGTTKSTVSSLSSSLLLSENERSIHRRGDDYIQEQQQNQASLSLEERKKQARERIAKLRANKANRAAKSIMNPKEIAA